MDFWARVLGGLALLVSFISMIISYRTYRRDKSDLRVGLEYHHRGPGASFIVRVVNHGRRTARVEHVHVTFPTSKPLAEGFLEGEPVMEGQPLDVRLTIYSRSGEPDVPSAVTGAVVWDTLGNRYSYPGRSLRALIEFARMKKKIRRQWSEYLASKTGTVDTP